MRNPYGPDRRQCRRCGEIKSITKFRRWVAICKPCVYARSREYYHSNPDKSARWGKTYRQKHAHEISAKYAADPFRQTRGIWRTMIQRCEDPNHSHFKYYGARGIKVCDRWRNSLKDFIQDVGLRPSREYSIDRWPDVNGDYEPGNVRWATAIEQRANRRDSRRAA